MNACTGAVWGCLEQTRFLSPMITTLIHFITSLIPFIVAPLRIQYSHKAAPYA